MLGLLVHRALPAQAVSSVDGISTWRTRPSVLICPEAISRRIVILETPKMIAASFSLYVRRGRLLLWPSPTRAVSFWVAFTSSPSPSLDLTYWIFVFFLSNCACARKYDGRHISTYALKYLVVWSGERGKPSSLITLNKSASSLFKVSSGNKPLSSFKSGPFVVTFFLLRKFIA